MSVGKFKNNITNFGSSIGTSIGVGVNNVKHRVGHKKDFDSDDKLIAAYRHDIKRAVGGLHFILSQTHRFANAGLPRVFRAYMKSVEAFNRLLGLDSLEFEGIEEYYHEFDRMQAVQETPMVHPKEMKFEVAAVNEQIYNHMVMVDRLTAQTLDSWDIFYQEIKLRVKEMQKYLKDVLKLIKKREKRQYKYERIHNKLEKLMKKTTPLDEKEQKSLTTLEKDIKEARHIYTLLDDKLRAISPHVLGLMEEFVDSLTKMIMCKQLETFKSIYATLEYYSLYYGIADFEKNEKKVKQPETYQQISEAWETAITPARLQIETFVNIIHDKNPELINEEIDDEDKTTKTGNLWNKMTRKMVDKSFKLKLEDPSNGLFNGDLVEDILDSFAKYQNPNANVAETYHPTKMIDEAQVWVPESNVNTKPLPSLPPRTNTVRAAFLAPPTSPLVGKTPVVTSPLPTPGLQQGEFDRPDYDDDPVESDTDSDATSFKSDDFGSDEEKDSLLASADTSQLLESSDPSKVNASIAKLFNSSKNKITEAPIHINKSELVHVKRNDALDDVSTVTHKLEQFNKYFHKVLKASETLVRDNRMVTAKHAFHGVRPGDLSFQEGDQVAVLFEFSDTNVANELGEWWVGLVKDSSGYRMGFVPSNYF